MDDDRPVDEKPNDAVQRPPAAPGGDSGPNGAEAPEDVARAHLDIANKYAEVGGIEILVKLAEAGDIDAKNVDIIDVTDKFLRAIAAAPKENLRQSGKIIFHASVLLRMKAEALLAEASDEVNCDDFLEFDEFGSPIIYDSRNQAVGRQITLRDLERALIRKISRQQRHRKVTLEQLIDALKEAERIEKTRQDKKPRNVIDLADHIEVNDVDDILELAHDEDIEMTIARVDMIIEKFIQKGETLELVQLIKLLRPKGDWVDAFLAILFLSNAGRITLEQEEFYGPVYLVPCEPVSVPLQAS